VASGGEEPFDIPALAMKKPPVPSAQGVDWAQMGRPSIVIRGSWTPTVGLLEEYSKLFKCTVAVSLKDNDSELKTSWTRFLWAQNRSIFTTLFAQYNIGGRDRERRRKFCSCI
jgi:hypothetical protein